MKPPRTVRRPDNTEGNVAEQLAMQLERITEQLLRQSDTLEHLRGNIVNSVLFSGSIELDPQTGKGSLGGWTIPAGSVWISNRCAAAVTVVASVGGGDVGGTPPRSGSGVFVLDASYAETYPVDASHLDFYGPADGQLNVVVWATAAKPLAGGVA